MLTIPTTAQPKTMTKVHTKDVFFLLNEKPPYFVDDSSTWNLSGSSCFNVESKLNFHLNLFLTPGRTQGRFKLAMNMTGCNSNIKHEWLPKLRKLVVKLYFHDEGDQILQENCFQLDPKSLRGESKTTLEDFMARETLEKLCRHKKEGITLPPLSQSSFYKEFVFVKLTAELELILEANTCNDHLFTLTKCELTASRHFLATKRFLAESTCDSESEVPTISKKYKKVAIKKGNKFSEMVIFKVGPDEQQLMAYKNKIMSISPVFERMLTVDMMEKSANVIILKEEDPQTVENFLSLLFTSKYEDFDKQVLEMSAPEILDLIGFAHMYQLTQLLRDLTTALVKMPSNRLTQETVFSMYVAGCKFEVTDLKFRALQLMKEIKSKISQTEFKQWMAGKDPKYLCYIMFELL